MQLDGKSILITGAAVRVGRAMAEAVAKAGATVIVHYGSSDAGAQSLQSDLIALGHAVHLLKADLSKPEEVANLIEQANKFGPLFGLVNNAAIFEDRDLSTTDLASWQRHMDINLTAPFFLSQAFWRVNMANNKEGRIINILDWRALRPGRDHLPYTITKAGLAALTHSLAASMAPLITLNGIAFGAILPPKEGSDTSALIRKIPAGRWATLEEVGETLVFLLSGPSYITGEIIYLDGGRHLV